MNVVSAFGRFDCVKSHSVANHKYNIFVGFVFVFRAVRAVKSEHRADEKQDCGYN